MKKYRIKKEVLEKVSGILECSLIEQLSKRKQSVREWRNENWRPEALEEVPSRIELELAPLMDKVSTVCKKDKSIILPDEKILMEKALNGELLDIDSLDVYYFEDWFHSINTKPYVETKNIITVLKAYLKHKQNG